MSSSEEVKSETSNETASDADSSSPPNSTLPRCTSQWDSCFVDKLGVRQIEEDILDIILQRWRLVCLTEEDEKVVDECLLACDFELNYLSLEDAKHIYENAWVLTPKQVARMTRFPLLSKFLMKLDDFYFILAEIVLGNDSESGISESRYETLFEKLLQLFGLYTLNHSFISTEKAMIRGRTMSSKADITVYSQVRQKQKSERKVVFICEVKKNLQEDELDSSPPRKKQRSSSTQEQEEPECSFRDQDLWMQHIGQLFVYLDSSLSLQGTLGFTVEKTWVRVTYLEVTKSAKRKIKNTPGNRVGTLEYEEGEQPKLFYSKRYNFLNRKDRKVLFKALLLIRTMQEKQDKVVN
ncbi:uncharacterized protein LOC133189146 [Saccostrea echinata]|uniref:uncharacterized protein LOC133189146 n=1 Tax=Saccostrea echinata TaxID=191078 RepID=UPI002A83C3BB|nr:uncharacterized protein LOC133189146 [Saccostrea echinata]